MAIKRLLGLGKGILLIIFLASCVPIQETGLPAQQLPVPAGHYGSVLRFSSGKILIQTGRLDRAKIDALSYYWLTEDQLVRIPFKDDLRCQLTEYSAPTALPDGRLGLSEICRNYWPDRPIGQDDARFIVAYDWEAGAIEQIVEEPLSFETASFSWNPEMTHGVLSIGSLLGTIAWITPTGVEPMMVSIGTGEQSWSLAENLAVMEDYRRGNDRTTEVGIARNPAWSPDGRLIAFWASTNVIGRSGVSRARGTYSLYLLNSDTSQLQKILENAENVGSLVWSPDSQWLAFVGDIGTTSEGLWLVSADGNTLQFVDKGAGFDFYSTFNGWNWLNNQEILATRCLDENCNQAEVVKYDVSELVKSGQE